MSQCQSQCKTCGSKAPHLHPAVQYEGEVMICRDPFHNRFRLDPHRFAQRVEPPFLGFNARDDWEAERHLAEQAMERD
jgi:hypothetical protein